MKKATRILAMLIMLCLAVSLISACNTAEEESSTANAEVSTEKELFSTLPEKNYNGETVTVLVEKSLTKRLKDVTSSSKANSA